MKKRTAFVRCWNEEATVLASLLSVQNIFTKYVIIYSDITDNSLHLIEKFARGRNDIIIEKYPHPVHPPHSNFYKNGNYQPENSLAAYYNFGIELCKKVGGSICKVDCDQVYNEGVVGEQLIVMEKELSRQPHLFFKCGLWGINSFVYENKLFIPEQYPINGYGDTYIFSPNILIHYIQNRFYEVPQIPLDCRELPFSQSPAWFHFMKRIVGIDFEHEKTLKDFYEESNSFMILDDDLAQLFELKIRPLLLQTDSPYKNTTISF